MNAFNQQNLQAVQLQVTKNLRLPLYSISPYLCFADSKYKVGVSESHPFNQMDIYRANDVYANLEDFWISLFPSEMLS